jgi:DNA-binding IclR family transcriptional regulator
LIAACGAVAGFLRNGALRAAISARARRSASGDAGESFLGSIEKIRKQGFFFSRNLYSEGVGVIAMPLPRARSAEAMENQFREHLIS